MARTVILMGMLTPRFVGSASLPQAHEVWGCNHAYLHHLHLDRLYFLDPLESMSCTRDVNFNDSVLTLMEQGLRVVCQKRYQELPGCEAFDLKRATDLVGGRQYFQCSFDYMIADAIAEGDVEHVILDRVQHRGNRTYEHQLPSMNFWCGVAYGRGMQVTTSPDCAIMEPRSGYPRLYGYEYERWEELDRKRQHRAS